MPGQPSGSSGPMPAVWEPADPTGPMPAPQWPDPSDGAPTQPGWAAPTAPPATDWPAPSGEPLSDGGYEPTRSVAPMWEEAPVHSAPPSSPGYPGELGGPDRPARVEPRPPRGAHGGGRRPLHTDHLALGAVGVVLVVAVAALVLRPGGDEEPGDPEESGTATTLLVGGDATDPAGPIVGPSGVIGSWSGSEWVPRPEGVQSGADLDYLVLGLGGSFDTARGEAIAENCAAQGATSDTDVAVDLESGDDGPPAIAVAGVAEPRPRPVDQWNTDAPVYQQAAVDVAAGLGATAPPTLTQLLRTDLDGNGTDEIIVAAEHISDPGGLTPTAGDWSVVFLRRVASGGVATDVLASSVVGVGGIGSGGDGLERIQIATVADLNRDGTMEIALAGRSAAGEWTAIHAIDGDGEPSEVLRAGCEG